MIPMRPRSLEALESRRFDLLVIGAGIVGARTAYEAARCGLSVALVDARDFGGATSSSSSKLLHGGFRYLARGRFGLVREAQRERRLLAERVAPYLVWPRPLVVALGSTRRSRRLKLAAGIRVYDALAGMQDPRPRLLGRQEATFLVPSLNVDEAGALALIHEMQTNDARLTLATIEAAVREGATVANYARVVELGRTAAVVEDVLDRAVATIRFRAVVNAAGPWVDSVRRLEWPAARPLVRLSKGTQAMLALPEGWLAGVAVFDERRSAFAVPWQGMLLLGVTDSPFDEDPDGAGPAASDLDELRGALARFLPSEEIAPERVLSVSSALRVLPPGDDSTVDASRTHVVEASGSGMVSVAGGKLTTHRLIALEALRRLPADVRPRPVAPAPLPGAGRLSPPAELDQETAAYLFSMYGSRVGDVLACAADDPSWLEPIVRGGPDLWAQARYAVEREWALTADDVLQRRTTVALRGLDGENVRDELYRRLRARALTSGSGRAVAARLR